MNKNNPLLFILLILVIFILVALLLYFWSTSDSEDMEENNLMIEETFDDKIVYTTKQDIDLDRYKRDCSSRGGEFNQCGTICPSDSEICVQVCAYTCEFGDPSRGTSTPASSEDWDTYRNDQIGFSLEYPDSMELNESGSTVRFIYEGETQRQGTELYDGISFTVRAQDLESGRTIQGYIDDDIEQSMMLGEVLEDTSTTTFAGYTAYTYVTSTLGVFNKTVIPVSSDEYDLLMVVYSAPDPENKGYQEKVERILSSFEIIENN